MWNIKTSLRRGALAALVVAGLVGAPGVHAESLTCVEFVQRASTVALHGNAWQWWSAAAGRYDRGRQPYPGAVMVFAKSRALPLGHVAKVRVVRDRRTILVDHANWSPIRGRRGQVEWAVAVVDVSPANDWSRVRVWYRPAADVGHTVYQVNGFVYPAAVRHHAR
jgi:surface antigen